MKPEGREGGEGGARTLLGAVAVVRRADERAAPDPTRTQPAWRRRQQAHNYVFAAVVAARRTRPGCRPRRVKRGHQRAPVRRSRARPAERQKHQARARSPPFSAAHAPPGPAAAAAARRRRAAQGAARARGCRTPVARPLGGVVGSLAGPGSGGTDLDSDSRVHAPRCEQSPALFTFQQPQIVDSGSSTRPAPRARPGEHPIPCSSAPTAATCCSWSTA